WLSTVLVPATFYALSLHDALPICMITVGGKFGEICFTDVHIFGSRICPLGFPDDHFPPHSHVFGRLYIRSIVVIGRLVQIKNHLDRKSTRLNSSHVKISYAVFCLK